MYHHISPHLADSRYLKYRVILCDEMLLNTGLTGMLKCFQMSGDRKQFQAEITLSLPADNVTAN